MGPLLFVFFKKLTALIRDSVSSVGLTSGFNLPETTDGMAHVCHFRQALALDERRVKFWPEYASRSRPGSTKEPYADVKEVWFAGSHSDVSVIQSSPQFDTY